MKDSTKRIAVGTLIAGAVGYVTGILTAPKSGKETRKDIKDTAVSGMHEAERQLKKYHTELNEVIADAKDEAAKLSGKAKSELETAADAAKQAKEKARQILSAVHDGQAEDRELQKAIKDAKKSIDHLKAYLKK